jgi:hypothetical protein
MFNWLWNMFDFSEREELNIDVKVGDRYPAADVNEASMVVGTLCMLSGKIISGDYDGVGMVIINKVEENEVVRSLMEITTKPRSPNQP